MIKRLLFAVLLVLAPALLSAEVADRDMLVTADGVTYTVESVFAYDYPNVVTSADRFITLTIDDNGTRTVKQLPASLSAGAHLSPAITWDPDSKTLFIFWQKTPNAMISELFLCAYRDGRFSAPAAIDQVVTGEITKRMNLRIGATRSMEVVGADSKITLESGLNLHAIWWDQTGKNESARYAMISIDKGEVQDIDVRDLRDYLGSTPTSAYTVADDFNREILRHPAMFEAKNHASVDVVFADTRTNGYHRVNLRPVSNGRLRVPVGRQSGSDFGPPPVFKNEIDSRVSVLPSPESNKLVFYFTGKNALQYLIGDGDHWTDVKSITIDDKTNAYVAADALRRMINTQ
jgi:hypothetical protein